MIQAGPALPRRALFAAAALPLLGGVVSFGDARFLAWERELCRLEALPLPADDDEADAQLDQCGRLAELIRATPGSSPVAARAKVRSLIGEAEMSDSRWIEPLKDILAALGGR
jgi:hypothetical protein